MRDEQVKEFEAQAEVRCVWPAGATLGEGAVWVARENALYWVDIKAPAVHRYEPDSGARRTWPMSEQIGFLVERASGGFVAGLQSGLAILDLEADQCVPLGGPELDQPGNRLNDGACDAAGRLWMGSMDDAETDPSGVLYRVMPDHRWQPVDGGYIITNGPAFSPDGGTLYHTDTPKRTIYAFDLAADGEIGGKRALVRIADDSGFPDGMTVDAEGYLWVAHFGGWRLSRFTPAGELDRVVEMPVANITNCAFGGKGLDTLFVTTAAKGLNDSQLRNQPLAGGLFEIFVGVRGLAPTPFAG